MGPTTRWAPPPATTPSSSSSLILINDSSNSNPTFSISQIIMTLNRKLLQQQQDPFHPILPPTLLRPINDSPPTSSGADFNPNNTSFDTSMALTILVLLTALFFMSFFSFYIRRFSAADEHSTRRRGFTSASASTTTTATAIRPRPTGKGLDPELIKSLPTFAYGGDAKHRIDCSICLSEFEEGETVKLISYCRHGFHPGCIDTWLASHVSCPLCRSTQLFGEVGLGAGDYSVGGEVTTRSTASDDDVVGTAIIRRTCSFSSVTNDRLSLPRSNSF